MALNQVRVTFYTDVEATSHEEIDEAIGNLLDQLGKTETDLSWDDCEWDLTHAPRPLTLTKEEARVE
jgi:hypothetical protein